MTIKLAWDASISPDVVSYNLYYGSSPEEWVEYRVLVGNALTYTLDLPAGQWYFRVTAVDAAGNESIGSNPVDVVVPEPVPIPPPTGITLLAPLDRQLKLTRRKTNTSKLLFLTVNKDDKVTFNGVSQ